MADVDYDKRGHCCYCHGQIARTPGDGGKTLPRGNKVAKFLLADRSKLHVCLCSDCFKVVGKSEFATIKQACIDGWQREVDSMTEWDQAQKDAYMEKYSNIEILDRVE